MRIHRLSLFIPLVIFLLLAALLWRGLQLEPRLLPSALLGQPLPDFELPDLLEPQHTVTSQDLTGRYSVLNVWASWCHACRSEHPIFLQLAQEEGVNIYGLNYKDDPNDAKTWLYQLGNPYVAIGADQVGKVAIDLGVYGAPETFLIDPQGIIRYRHVGILTPTIWQIEFLPRMQEK